MFMTIKMQKIIIALLAVLMVAVVAVIIILDPEKSAAPAMSHDTQKYTLVIDAGHGGEDGGAVSPGGMIESYVNLDIAKRLEALAKFFGITPVMTRTTDEIQYPAEMKTTRARKNFDQAERVKLINSIPNALLMSIHQNKFPDSRPRGSQVFYNKIEPSAEFASLAQQNLTSAIYPENRRLAAPADKDLYIPKNVDCPMILVECAFLSNTVEAALLETPEFKIKIAQVLFCSYRQFQSAL